MLKDFRLLLATTCILCIYVPGEGHQKQYLGFSVPRHLVKILRMELLSAVGCSSLDATPALHTEPALTVLQSLAARGHLKKKKKKSGQLLTIFELGTEIRKTRFSVSRADFFEKFRL